MAYNPILSSEIQVKQPVKQELMQKVKDNFDYLYGLSGDTYGQIFNGSFEIDADNDGIPDGWTRTLYSNGSGGYETTSPAHGAKAYKFIHPGSAGSGGGHLESDYIPVSYNADGSIIWLMWQMWSTVAGIKNQVIAFWYDKAKVALANPNDKTILHDSTINPVTPTLFLANLVPPVGSCFVKIRLVGGESSVSVAGTTYFDNTQLTTAFSPSINSNANGTIAEGTTQATAWSDQNSVVLIPARIKSGIYNTTITFTGQGRAVAGSQDSLGCYYRFRIGAINSNEVTISAAKGTYQSNTFTIAGNIDWTHGGITLVAQARVDNAANHAVNVQKTSAATAISF